MRQHRSRSEERGGGEGEGGLTGEDKHQEADQCTIPQIQHPAHQPAQMQLRGPVRDRMQEDVERAGAGGQERAPVPVVVLGAEQEVDEEDCDRGGRGDHEAVAEEEEAEHVVHLAEPDGAHDEVELDEDGAEGEEADEQHGRDRAQVGCRRGDLARDLVCAHGRRDGGLPEAEPGAGEGEGDGDDEPDQHDDEHRREGHGAAGALEPEEEIEEEEGCEDQAGDEKRGQCDVELPALAAEGLVDARRDVAADEAEDGVQNDHDGAERAAIGGREEAEQREGDGGTGHDEKLRAVAEENG